MNLRKLEENLITLESIQKENKNLAAKLAIADENKAHERSVQFLLNFELSQIKSQIARAKKDVSCLEEEEKSLMSRIQQLNSEVKQYKSYFNQLNKQKVERKAEWLQNIKNELSTLDFTLEARQEEPSRQVEAFTQYKR